MEVAQTICLVSVVLCLLGVNLRVRNVAVEVALLLRGEVLVLGVCVEVQVPRIGSLAVAGTLDVPEDLLLSVVSLLLLTALAGRTRVANALLLLKVATLCGPSIRR